MASRTSSIVLAATSRAASDPFAKDVIDLRNVLLKLMTALADRLQHALQHLVEHLLTLHVANSTCRIGCLQFVETAELGPEFREVIVGGESIEIGKDGISLHMAWIADIQVGRVGVHGLHLLPHRILVVGEIDAVAKALAHLLLAIRLKADGVQSGSRAT